MATAFTSLPGLWTRLCFQDAAAGNLQSRQAAQQLLGLLLSPLTAKYQCVLGRDGCSGVNPEQQVDHFTLILYFSVGGSATSYLKKHTNIGHIHTAACQLAYLSKTCTEHGNIRSGWKKHRITELERQKLVGNCCFSTNLNQLLSLTTSLSVLLEGSPLTFALSNLCGRECLISTRCLDQWGRDSRVVKRSLGQLAFTGSGPTPPESLILPFPLPLVDFSWSQPSNYLFCNKGKCAWQQLELRNPPGMTKHSNITAVLPLPASGSVKALLTASIKAEAVTAKRLPLDFTAPSSGTADNSSLYHNRQKCNKHSRNSQAGGQKGITGSYLQSRKVAFFSPQLCLIYKTKKPLRK